jgi:prophage antirepressor-like protein
MNSVITFSFDGHDIRVVKDVQGSFWFVGRDICLAHGLKNPNVSMRARWKYAVPKLLKIKDRMGRDSDVRVLSAFESLDLIQRMHVPVPGFETWFVKKVLPRLNGPAAQQLSKA